MLQRVDHAKHNYQFIRDCLLADDPELDERTLADTVEGLTDLHEIVAAIVRSAVDDEALAEGLKGRIGQMKERLERLEDRSSKRRAIARDVMGDLELKKIIAPDLTISIRPGSPGLVVVDETAIPESFYEAREPRLNRQALLLELKGGATVAGVMLSEPSHVLSVRTR